MKVTKWLIKIAATALITVALAACSNIDKSAQRQTASTRSTIQKHLKNPNHVPRVNIYSSRYTSDANVDILPSWQTKKISIHAYKQPLSEVVSTITGGEHVQNIYYMERNHGNGAGSSTNTMANTLVSINYSGSVIGALNNLAKYNDVYFNIKQKYKNPVINWSFVETKTFEIAYMPGVTNFDVGNYSNNASSSSTNSSKDSTDTQSGVSNSVSSADISNNSSQDSNNQESGASLSGKVSVWQDVKQQIGNMLSNKGRMSVSEATSTVTVTDRPSNVEEIAKFIKQFNKNLSSRVTISVKVLEVDLDKVQQDGINWGVAYSFMGAKLGLNSGNFVQDLSGNTLSSIDNSTGFNTSILKGPWADTSVLIRALNKQGNTSIVTEPTVTSLNNQPNNISIGDSTSYLKQTMVTVVGSGSSAVTSTAFTPGNVLTGMNLTIIPHIQHGKVYMSLNASLSTLKDIKTITSKDQSSQIQLPDIQQRTFNQRIMASSGNTIVLSGFKLLNNNSNDTKNFGTSLLGGKTAEQASKELVVLIQPRIIK